MAAMLHRRAAESLDLRATVRLQPSSCLGRQA